MSEFAEVYHASAIGPRSVQQDAFFVAPEGHLIGVFDGHFSDGDRASRGASEALRSKYIDHGRDFTPTNLGADFDSVDVGLSGLDGGTTATLVSVGRNPLGDRVVNTAWVGDSPAYLLNPASQYPVGRALRLTSPHDATNWREVQRMDEEGIANDGVYFFHKGVGGLMVSRALGGSGMPSVISKPEMSTVVCAEGRERLLVVCSDGVVNYTTEREFIGEILDLHQQGRRFGKAIIDLADKYSQLTGDNATLVVAVLS